MEYKIVIMKNGIKFLMLLIGILVFQNAGAQNKANEVSELVNQILKAREAGNSLLQKYLWTSRTEVLKSKEILNIMIEKNQYDAQGKLIQKILNEQDARMPKAFLIREIAENEKENMEKFLYGLRDFLKKYSLKETEQIRRFIEAASWQVVEATHEFVFSGRNVEEEGDELIWTIDDIYYSTSKIEVSTTFLGDEVHFTATFNRLKDGLNYMAYGEAHIPSKNITLQVQNYDYLME